MKHVVAEIFYLREVCEKWIFQSERNYGSLKDSMLGVCRVVLIENEQGLFVEAFYLF